MSPGRIDSGDYNHRLFSGGIRTKLHTARFEWLRETIRRIKPEVQTVLELGCYDGRSLEYMGPSIRRYVGLDAGWEDGLDLARRRWSDTPQYEFRLCRDPKDASLDGETFQIMLALETLEHIDSRQVPTYLSNLAKVLAPDGAFLVTLPNEIGPIFATKYVTKKLLGLTTDSYSTTEFLFQTLGRTQLVARHEHKGFDYRNMLEDLRGCFRIELVQGLPFRCLPAYMSFNIAIICRKKLAASSALL